MGPMRLLRRRRRQPLHELRFPIRPGANSTPRVADSLVFATGIRARLLALGKDLLILDKDGNLAVATPSPEGLEIHRRAQILHSRAWTAPSLDGSILYVRDRKEIVALDLGPAIN